MTARKPPNPDGKNAQGNGRGLKKVTKPVTKKRGATVAKKPERLVENRRKYVDTSAIPVAQLAEVIDPDKPLTDKAKAFVRFWAQGESIQSAAIRAGYGDGASYAYRLVHYPQVKALYAEEKRLYEEAAQMTRKQVMEGFLDGIEMAKLMAEPANVISGWREIAKMCGYYEPTKKTIDLNIKGQVLLQKLDRYTDAQLIEMLTQQAPELLQEDTDEGDGPEAD